MSDIIQSEVVRWEDLDKLTTLDPRRHALYHGVCGVGLTISGGYQIFLRSFLTGSITLTFGLTLVMLVFVNLTSAGLRIVFISTFIVITFAIGNFVCIAIRFRETTIRFHNFDYGQEKTNEALILQSERREIWNLIVSGVLLLTEIILSLAIYARIIDFGDDIQRQELVVIPGPRRVESGYMKAITTLGVEKRVLPKATSLNYTIIPQSALGYVMDNSDLIEQIELEQAQQNEIDDEIILCMAHEGEPDD